MLILQIAVGIVIGVIALNYIEEILAIGLVAIIAIVALGLIAVVGIYLFKGITTNSVIAVIALIVVCFIFLKFYLKGENIQKILRDRISRRESLGYDTSDLKLKLKEFEDKEFEANKLKQLSKEKDKSATKMSDKDLVKERERRRILGYDK
uniref:hypothetical protein n=1 Tax=Polynucleobacter sp. TaxID=2029855 RepID=UPI0040471F6C